MTKIAFIGAGNMNRAIIIGLIKSGFPPANVIVSNPSPQKRESLAQELGVLHTADNVEAASFADIIVLGVKPYLITEVCKHLKATIDLADKCFISVAAGTTIEQMQDAAGQGQPVIRVMPNTPSQIGLGVSGIYASEQVTEDQKAIATQVMESVGIVKWLDKESDIDHIIAVSGSAPAYFFLFMEAMAAEAVRLGFSEQESRELVQQTALGAAQMVVDSSSSIATLRENVTSKGGTTQAALKAFTDGGLPELVSDAMQAAIKRAKEMAQQS